MRILQPIDFFLHNPIEAFLLILSMTVFIHAFYHITSL